MSPWLKLLMVWLLALALPVQSVAAATMLHCGGGHARAHGVGMQAEYEQRAQHDQHAHATHGVDVSHSDAGSHSVGPHEHQQQPDKLADLGPHKCGACGACCCAAVMPRLLLQVPELPPLLQWQAVVFRGHVGFVTDGPDRPPRHQHA